MTVSARPLQIDIPVKMTKPAQSESSMRLLAFDLVTTPAVVAEETMTIREVARLMDSKGVSAVPVLNASGEAIGMASDGDLLGRLLNDGRPAWWLSMLARGSGADEAFVKHGDRPVREVMSAPLFSVGPNAMAQDIAEALLTHRVKRLPVTKEGRVLGVVSRANLIAVVEGIPRLHLEEEHGAGLLSFLESLIGGASLRGVVPGARPILNPQRRKSRTGRISRIESRSAPLNGSRSSIRKSSSSSRRGWPAISPSPSPTGATSSTPPAAPCGMNWACPSRSGARPAGFWAGSAPQSRSPSSRPSPRATFPAGPAATSPPWSSAPRPAN